MLVVINIDSLMCGALCGKLHRPPSQLLFELQQSSIDSQLFVDNSHFCRAMLASSAVFAVMRCLSVCMSVCLSVTFVSCVKTNKHIIKTFSPSGSHAILVFFRAKQHSNIPTGTPLTGASNAGGVGRNRDSEPISGFTSVKGVFIATQLNSTRRRIELRRYRHFADATQLSIATQLNSTELN